MRLVLAALALLLMGASPPNWANTVTRAPNGAFVLGNPKAKVRVVEYLSYTCPHCAQLVTEGGPVLKTRYVARGGVALEVRNAVRDRLDFTMALAARCGGTARFLGNHEALFAAQASIFERANAFKAQADQPVNEALKALARGAGITAIMGRRGVTPAQLDACLVDKASQDAVLAMNREAWETRKIPYTPYVLVNGAAVEGTTWATIEPAIRAATSG